MKPEISPLAVDEIDELCRVARETWHRHYPPIIGLAQTEYMLDQRYDPGVIRAELANPRVWWDVLRHEGAICAFASSFPADSPDTIKLDKLYVHPERQRHGFGAALVRHVCDRARALGFARVELAVNKGNASAIAAYRKYGFDIVDAVVKEIGGGFVMDDYLMAMSVRDEGGGEKSEAVGMKLKFTKMHGLGNDFVVLDATRTPLALDETQLRFIADRHFGIGCDQILQVEPPRTPDTDFYYRIFNSDGGEVEQCGNGARCFVRYVHERGLTKKTAIRVGTAGGVIVPRLEHDGQVTVDMGVPVFDPRKVPFVAEAPALTYHIPVGDLTIEASVLSMGNPHAVQVVPDVETAPVLTEGPLIESHPRFPRRVNAGYMQVIDPHRIRLRVYERGAGETLACGTGACAAVVAGITRKLLERERVVVETRGGELTISWPAEEASVMMTGPAVTVFEGEIMI